MRIAGLITLALATGACDEGGKPQPVQAPATAEAAATTASPDRREPTPDEPTPDPITHPCVVAAAQFDLALDAADAHCESDADCDCFPGGVTEKAGCGGVTSAASAKQLHAIAQAFRADGCDWAQLCAAQRCEPKCVDGVCR